MSFPFCYFFLCDTTILYPFWILLSPFDNLLVTLVAVTTHNCRDATLRMASDSATSISSIYFVRNTYRVVVHISWMIYSIRSAILSLFRNPISFQFYSGRTWRRIQVRMKICWMALSNIYDDESGYFFVLSLYSCRLLRKHHSSNSAQSPRNSSKQKKNCHIIPDFVAWK